MTEVLIAVAIIALLVSVAIPQYRKTVERNYRQQAQDILTTIYYGEKAYQVVRNTFTGAPPWVDIFMDDPHVGATPPINFTVAAAAKTFTAQAARAAGSGPCAGQTMTINETGLSSIAGPWLACP